MPTTAAAPTLTVEHRRFASPWWPSAWSELRRYRTLGYRRCVAHAVDAVRSACEEQRAYGQLRRAGRRLRLPVVCGDEAFYVHARGSWYLLLFMPRQRQPHGSRSAYWMRYDVNPLCSDGWADEFVGRGLVDSPHGRDVIEAFAADSWLTADGTQRPLPLHQAPRR